MLMGRQERVIWAAGFIDGEGCVAITRHKARKRHWPDTFGLEIRVFQKFPGALAVLHELFGGSLYPRKPGKLDNGGWIWYAYGSSAVCILQELMPFLVVKKAQAELAIAFQSRKGRRGERDKEPVVAREQNIIDYGRMRELKKEE